ncbi:50S ribosomal protein L6 [Legionella sp. W05-934-2]|uniref:50S ribosomal protein L6 n=1 Tax=Legionella sp. W05-934-2 TaxID=1198649 RepID=UPI00346228AE
MSRVAKAPVQIPKNVEVNLASNEIKVKGPQGTLTKKFNHLVKITIDGDSQINFQPANDHPNGWAQAGTARRLTNNMVIGVTDGFTRTMELVGVGYRAQAAGKKVNLSLGFSHPIAFDLPEGITAETPSATVLIIKGIDKELVGHVSSKIRALRPPEPYKGKGIRYSDEQIVKKEAKKK